MSQYSDVLYGVEPYTGKIICHTGQKGMKWGHTNLGKTLVDAGKQAIGKLTSTGQYIYDRAASGQLGSRTINNARTAATNISNYAIGRTRSGQLGSRTINNARNTATNVANRVNGVVSRARTAATNVANRASGVASRVRTAAGNVFDTAKTGAADTLMKSNNKNAKILGNRINKTTKRYKDSVKKSQNMKAASARNRAAESRGNRYIYENRTLAGNIEREGRKIRSATNNVKNTLSRVGKSIVSAPGKAVNKVNNASSNATSRYQNFANNFNKGIQDWWDTKITGKKYKK